MLSFQHRFFREPGMQIEPLYVDYGSDPAMAAEFFYNGIRENKLIQISEIVKKCEDFEPRTMFKIFLQGILEAQKSPVDKDENSGRNAEVEIKNIS